jgi:hypothetical protein
MAVAHDPGGWAALCHALCANVYRCVSPNIRWTRVASRGMHVPAGCQSCGVYWCNHALVLHFCHAKLLASPGRTATTHQQRTLT